MRVEMIVLKRRSQVGGASGSLGVKLGSKVLSKVVGQGKEQRPQGGDSAAQKCVHESSCDRCDRAKAMSLVTIVRGKGSTGN